MHKLGAFTPTRPLYIWHVVCIYEPVMHDVVDDYDDAVCGGINGRPAVAFYVAS